MTDDGIYLGLGFGLNIRVAGHEQEKEIQRRQSLMMLFRNGACR
jgi:hypothetical protein